MSTVFGLNEKQIRCWEKYQISFDTAQQLNNLRWGPANEVSFFVQVMNIINPVLYAHASSFSYKHGFQDSAQMLEFHSLYTQRRLLWYSHVPETSPGVESHQTSFHSFTQGAWKQTPNSVHHIHNGASV